jgi:electron transfer flavoprotein beta subunit
MKARAKPLTTLTPAELNVDITPRTKVVSVAEPAKRKGGGKVKDVAELVDKLRNEAKVIS